MYCFYTAKMLNAQNHFLLQHHEFLNIITYKLLAFELLLIGSDCIISKLLVFHDTSTRKKVIILSLFINNIHTQH